MDKRIFVEKKADFRVKSQSLVKELKHNLQLKTLNDLRIVQVYDVFNLAEDLFARAEKHIFSEQVTDTVLDEAAVKADLEKYAFFAIESLPGQFDQRAASSQEALLLLGSSNDVIVNTAQLYLVNKDIDTNELEAVKNYLLNPVDSRFKDITVGIAKQDFSESDKTIPSLDFFETYTAEDFAKYKAEQGLAMEVDDLLFIQDYENIKGSLKPNEIYVYSNVEKVKEKTLSLFGKEYVVKGQLNHLKMDESNPNVTEHYYIIVDSEKTLETMQQDQLNVYNDNASTIYASYSFDCDANEREVIKKLGQNGNINNFIWLSKSDQKQGLIELYAGILFIGIFLSFLFIMATILIMYYKQITEGYEDKDRFEIMQKVGLEQQDVKKAIHSQVLTVFFMPLLVAGLHVCFAYPMIEKLLHLLFVSDSWLYIRTTMFCFVAFALVYIVIYVLTSKVYYGIVKRNA